MLRKKILVILYKLVITIISNPIILYEIGKICAKGNLKLDMGLLCLSDYIHILKFQNNYVLDSHSLKLKFKAYYYKGVIYCYQKLYKYLKIIQ